MPTGPLTEAELNYVARVPVFERQVWERVPAIAGRFLELSLRLVAMDAIEQVSLSTRPPGSTRQPAGFTVGQDEGPAATGA
jgi:hypothetical protein